MLFSLSQFLEVHPSSCLFQNTLNSSFYHTPCLIHHEIVSLLASEQIQSMITSSTSIAITFAQPSPSLYCYNTITIGKSVSLLLSCTPQLILNTGARRSFGNISQIISLIFPNPSNASHVRVSIKVLTVTYKALQTWHYSIISLTSSPSLSTTPSLQHVDLLAILGSRQASASGPFHVLSLQPGVLFSI